MAPPQPNSTVVLSGHKDCVRTVAWNITGTRLASGSTDKTIRVWNPEKPEVRYSLQLKGHSQTVDQLCWDPTNPDHLVSASHDKTVRFWDYRCTCAHIVHRLICSAQSTIREIPTKGENINITWSPDGATVAVASKVFAAHPNDKLTLLQDDIITIIDARQYKVIKSFKEPIEVYLIITLLHHSHFKTNEMAWSHSGDLFLLTNGSGKVKILEWPSLELLHTLYAHTSDCFCLEFDPRGR
jgi:THO complex subunit 3